MFIKLIIFLSITSSCFCAKYNCSIETSWLYDGETCTISGLNITQTQNDFNIQPVAENSSAVTRLILQGNVSILTSGFCAALPNLKDFYANYVSMEVITNFAFDGCQELKKIIMWENNFHRIEENSFKGLTKLNHLSLFGGNIPVFDVDLSDLIKLKTLELSSLNITEFSAITLRHQNKLQILYLQSNNLFNLNIENILNFTKNLREIYLADNSFKCSRLLEIIQLLKENHVKVKTSVFQSRNQDDSSTKIEGIHCLSDKEWFEKFFNNPNIICHLERKIENVKLNNT